jgi:hypothetical protein
MTTHSIQPPFPTFSEADGSPLEAGYIWIGTANLNPITNPISVYWDVDLTLPAAQPIRTQGGYPVNSGTPARLYVNSNFSIQVQNSKGSVVYNAPDGAADRFSAAQISFIQAGAGAVARTVQSKLREFPISLADYGLAPGGDIYAAAVLAQAALPATGGSLLIPDSSTAYTMSAQVTFTKSVRLIVGNCPITGPTAGFAFDFTVNDSSVEWHPKALLTLSAGCSGGIRNNQILRGLYRGIRIDPNNVANCICFHQLGGWYIDIQDFWTEQATSVATCDALKIQSVYTGVPGPTGSYGGSFVGTYTNVTGNIIRLLGDNSGGVNPVTTCMFIRPSVRQFIATRAVRTQCVMPIVQSAGVPMFDFTGGNVNTWHNSGGDFEGEAGSTVYAFGASCTGITSSGNGISNTGGMSYLSGTLPASSYFYDDQKGSTPLTGFLQAYVGSVEPVFFQNSGFTSAHPLGIHYDGNVMEMGCNLKSISATTGNLIDVSQAGTVMRINTSGAWELYQATAGVNPRTLNKIGQFDANGFTNTLGGTLARTAATLNNGSGASAGTLLNAPIAGNPTKWVPVNDNGTIRYCPLW